MHLPLRDLLRHLQMSYEALAKFVRLIIETHIREVDITDGKAPHGSEKHISDLQGRIEALVKWRDKQRKGTETRANYTRLITRLRSELKSAMYKADKAKKKKIKDEH